MLRGCEDLAVSRTLDVTPVTPDLRGAEPFFKHLNLVARAIGYRRRASLIHRSPKHFYNLLSLYRPDSGLSHPWAMRGLVAAGIPIFLLSALPGCSCAIKHVGLMEATRAIRGMTPGTSGGALFRQLQKQESATEFGYDTSAWFVYRKEGEGGASQSKTRTVYDDFEKVTWVSKYLVKMQRALRPLGRRLEGEAGVNGTSATPSTATSNSNVSGNAFSHKVQEGAAEAASTDETRVGGLSSHCST